MVYKNLFYRFFLSILFFLIFFVAIKVSYLCFSLYFFIYFDFLIFFIFVFTIILFDSFSYFTGKLIGKNYIFKSISPKKTAEGYLGGIFFTNVIFMFYFYFIGMKLEINDSILLLNFIIFISIVGDLIESYFKRKNNIKDSSSYLPGHGGFFDRFDSFIASITFLTLYSFILNI